MKEAYIFDVVRTPRGRGKKSGKLYEVKPIDLLLTVMKALQARNGLLENSIDDIILGCVTPIAEQGSNLGRTVALYSGWCKQAPGMQINRFCASGLEAINLAAMKVRSGWEDLIIAGGVESMSRVPMGTDRGPLQYDPVVSSKVGYVPQGISADLIATKYGFSRKMLDEYALHSHQKAVIAMQNGYFDKSMIPVKDDNGMTVLSLDGKPNPHTNLEILGTLPPSFQTIGDNGYDDIVKLHYPAIQKVAHLHTAGNSGGFADGAALALIGSLEAGKRLNLKPRAKIKIAATASVNATIALEGTTPATKKALSLAKMTKQDIDLWEVNEAFAAPTLQFQNDFDIPMEKINVNGGSIAFGHPLGATGAMLLGTLLDELERQNLATGLVSLCMGGGMGVSTIVERIRN